jgi:hypothetical protein
MGPPVGRSGVGAFSCVFGPVMGRLLLPLCDLGEGDHLRQSLPVESRVVALGNELRDVCLWGMLSPQAGCPSLVSHSSSPVGV